VTYSINTIMRLNVCWSKPVIPVFSSQERCIVWPSASTTFHRSKVDVNWKGVGLKSELLD